MIKKLWLDNFKSLVNFELRLEKFTCLIGLNGAGKSTVLQGIDFIAQLMSGRLDVWLEQRQWQSSEIKSKLTKNHNFSFSVELETASFGAVLWSGSVNLRSLRCTKESVVHLATNTVFLKVEDSVYRVRRSNIDELPIDSQKGIEQMPIVFEYQGSILSRFKDNLLHPLLAELKSHVIGIHSLDLLSPELLRTRTKSADGHLGLGGQNLNAYLHESGEDKKNMLARNLASVYQQLKAIQTKALRSGWKELEVTERFGEQEIKTNSRHLNDGLLRLMAILSNITTMQQFLLFDEIENGINPELVEYLLDNLLAAPQQVVVTTHSPLILNFLEDEIARAGVMYLYKNQDGATQSIPFFSIPSMAEKLQFMGPGEVFADTNLMQLVDEITLLKL
jgi:AAA15 family ATPase/GTPase